MPNLFDPALAQTFAHARSALQTADIPMVSIPDTSARFLAPLSLMRYAAREIEDKKIALVDPTNQLSEEVWQNFAHHQKEVTAGESDSPSFFSQLIGGLQSVTSSSASTATSLAPMIYLAQDSKKPMISFHPELTYTLASAGHPVLHTILDSAPTHEDIRVAHVPFVGFAVPDEESQASLLEQAAVQDKTISLDRIFVTGVPTLEPLPEEKKQKNPWRSGTLKIAILADECTEVEWHLVMQFLAAIMPTLHHSDRFALRLVCGVDKSRVAQAQKLAQDLAVPVGHSVHDQHLFTIIESSTVLNSFLYQRAEALLWADCCVCSSNLFLVESAAAYGCAILSTQPYKSRASTLVRTLLFPDILDQVRALTSAMATHQSWIEKTMQTALIEKTNSQEKLVDAYGEFKKMTKTIV